MSKAQLLNQNYESLVEDYSQAKKNAYDSLLDLAKTISKALQKLGERKWKTWLKDSRVKLNQTQAYKFVAVAKFHQNNLQLTEGIKNINIEKAYLLTRIKEPEKQTEVAEEIIEADFTVKQTKKAVELINAEIPTKEALKQAKEEINTQKKVTPEKVPKELYDKLKQDYENLLAKYQQMQGNIIQSDKPETTTKPDGTLDKINRRVALKGYWIPVSSHMNLEAEGIELDIKYDAISNAKKLYNLDLDDPPPVEALNTGLMKTASIPSENTRATL